MIQRVLPKQAPPYLASKWLHFDFLVETAELRTFFTSIDKPLLLFSTMGVQQKGGNCFTQDSFLTCYEEYLKALRSSQKNDDRAFRFFFTACLTLDEACVRALDLADNKEMIIPYLPCVQMQMHRFIYSSLDHSFKTQSFGQNSISWGVRLSYPVLFQHPETRTVEKALDQTKFCNGALLPHIRAFLRNMTVATPFIIENKRVNMSSRLGKQCFSWINQHPDLVLKNLTVEKIL
jgi:hypothetical protein